MLVCKKEEGVTQVVETFLLDAGLDRKGLATKTCAQHCIDFKNALAKNSLAT